MLGLADWQILLVYILSVVSALLCIVYGLINWNKSDSAEDEK